MTNETDTELNDLQNLWQGQDMVDISGLAKKAQFMWWRMRIVYFIEVIGALLGLAMAIKIGMEATSFFVIFAMLWAICLVLSIWLGTSIRRGTWSAEGESARDLIRLQIRRAESTIKYLRMSTKVGYFGIILFPMAVWVIYDLHGAVVDTAFFVSFFIYFFSFIFILLQPLLYQSTIQRKKNEIDEMEALLKELEEDTDW